MYKIHSKRIESLGNCIPHQADLPQAITFFRWANIFFRITIRIDPAIMMNFE